VLLTQQIERNVPRSRHIFGGMVLPDAATVFIERDVQRPMELVLNIPMLANHRDENSRRPYEARNVDAIVTGDGSARVGRPNRFDDNHCLEIWPFRQLRKGREVRYGPYASPHRAAVRVIEGIKETLAGTPGQVVFDMLMKVLFDRGIGLFVVPLQGQEIVAVLITDVRRDGRLTAHGIDRQKTAFDSSQWEQGGNGRDLIGLRLGFGLA
jgi:hypothetical protein